MKRLIALAVVAVLALTACGPGLDSGTVVDRRHTSAWVQPIVTCSGNPPVCTTTPIFHPESWSLLIENGEDRDWVSVSSDDYESHPVGSEWERR